MSSTQPSIAAGPLPIGGADRSAWRDWLGMSASVGCAIHCATMPFVVASLPALGLGFLADEGFHQWMAVACFAIAIAAFVPGVQRHRRVLPAAIGAAGLMLITVAAFGLAGPCCPLCESSPLEGGGLSPSVAEAPSVAALGSVPALRAPAPKVCAAACCDHCEVPPSRETPEKQSGLPLAGGMPSPWHILTPFAALLTPIGGLLLVFAHFLNRRFGCLCERCGDR